MDTKQTKTPAKRKKAGAPAGNQNARKFGIFSRYLPAWKEDEGSEDPKRNLEQDLLILGARLLNALKEYKQAAAKGDEEKMLKWDKSILKHLEAMAGVRLRMVDAGQGEDEVWDTMEEAIHHANDRQKVKW